MSGRANPELLTLAREARGMTQGQLAELAGLNQGTLSLYENGLKPVRPEHLATLAKALRRPESFFFREESREGVRCHPRKRASLQVRELRRLEGEANMAAFETKQLFQSADVHTDIEFTRIELDEFDGDVELVAQGVRSAWRLPSGPIRDLVDTVERAGGIVVEIDFENDRIDALSQWRSDMAPIFLLNSRRPADRRRYTLAHEIGHVLMHHRVTPDPEREADRFAAEFLAPGREVRPDLSPATLQRFIQLKPYWRVSVAFLMRRARDLQVISESKYKRLNIELNWRGYKQVEPCPLPPEHPNTVRELIQMHLDDLQYSVEDVAALMDMEAGEFRVKYLGESDHLRLIAK